MEPIAWALAEAAQSVRIPARSRLPRKPRLIIPPSPEDDNNDDDKRT
jgi:hypothetical protein